jgi:hypothetical protein
MLLTDIMDTGARESDQCYSMKLWWPLCDCICALKGFKPRRDKPFLRVTWRPHRVKQCAACSWHVSGEWRFSTHPCFGYNPNGCCNYRQMVDVVANHMGIGDITTYTPFNNWTSYHDCNTCPSGKSFRECAWCHLPRCSLQTHAHRTHLHLCRL